MKIYEPIKSISLNITVFVLVWICLFLTANTGKSNVLQCKSLWNFNHGSQNPMKGNFNHFTKVHSTALTRLNNTVFRGKSGRSWEIIADKKKSGYCGGWMHFFDSREQDKQKRLFINTNEYKYLSFFVKGAQGGELFDLKLADERYIDIEDSKKVADIEELLSGGVTTEWQEVLLPLKNNEKLLDLDMQGLAGITFDFTKMGKWHVYIDDICLKKERNTPNLPTITVPQLKKINKKQTAMWVWVCNEPLDDLSRRKELLDFCKQNNINELFFQIIADAVKKDGKWVCKMQKQEEMRSFIRDCSARGIKVHALDGYPDWAMRPYHGKVLAQIKAIIDYNNNSRPEERFYGIHYDVEPYLMIGFNDKKHKQQILKEYCELNEKCARLVKSRSDMVYGIDIPFWFEERGDDGAVNGIVTFNGKTKPASYHLIDICDNVGIMNYRDFADGADGMVLHGRDEINYADKAGKNIYMGVETFKYDKIECNLALGITIEEFHKRLFSIARDFRDMSRINGFRVQVLRGSGYVHVGIEKPPKLSKKRLAEYDDAMSQIAYRFGVGTKNLEEAYMEGEFAVNKDMTWEYFKKYKIFDYDTGNSYPGFVSTKIMLPKITFAEEDLNHFNQVIQQVEYAFNTNPSFYGIAIHYYKTYKVMVEKAAIK